MRAFFKQSGQPRPFGWCGGVEGRAGRQFVSKVRAGGRVVAWLKKLAIGFSVVASLCLAQGQTPMVFEGKEAAKQVATFEDSLPTTEIHFFKDKLYVGTKCGLLEIEGDSLNRVYLWSKVDPVIEAVWQDGANGLLWVMLADGHRLAYYDGKIWKGLSFPKPAQGHFIRDDVFKGFRGVYNEKTFWVEGAGRAWAWAGPSSRRWKEERLPPEFVASRDSRPLVKRVVPTDEGVYFIRHDEREPLAIMERVTLREVPGDSAYWFCDGEWHAISNSAGDFYTAQAVAANRQGYIRTKAGEILALTKVGVTRLEAPGTCEALAPSASGTLLASFRGAGVYELAGEWHKRLENPYPNSESEHRVFLTARPGVIALVVAPEAEARSSSAVHTSANGLRYDSYPGIWVSEGQKWKQVTFGRR